MKAKRGSRGIDTLFNLGGRGGGWPTLRPGYFTTERRPVTHSTGGWVGPRAIPTCAEILAPTGIHPRIIQPAASSCADCAIPAHPCCKDKVQNLDRRESMYSLSRVRHKQTQRTSFNGAALTYKALLPKRIRVASCQWMKVYLCQEFEQTTDGCRDLHLTTDRAR